MLFIVKLRVVDTLISGNGRQIDSESCSHGHIIFYLYVQLVIGYLQLIFTRGSWYCMVQKLIHWIQDPMFHLLVRLTPRSLLILQDQHFTTRPLRVQLNPLLPRLYLREISVSHSLTTKKLSIVFLHIGNEEHSQPVYFNTFNWRITKCEKTLRWNNYIF